MSKKHNYTTTLKWTGNKGEGTKTYTAYERSYNLAAENKIPIDASSDPAFRGDPTKYNPEEFLLGALSSCHMLWYLHLCSDKKVIVLEYEDKASATMVENPDGSGQFSEVILRPRVLISEESSILDAEKLHEKANKMCFIARSCNFPVRHEPICIRKK